MCGICGIASRGVLGPDDIEAAQRVNARLIHRGPDGGNEFLDAGPDDSQVFLAMRRLSVIDLHGGWQPLWNENKSLALMANGEIYNHVELKAALQQGGHRFRTGSDCEVILHLYEEHGLDFVRHLRGMFAFALWDGRRRRLILGRDRLGEKPLYLYRRDSDILFASEMKALLSSGRVPFELDEAAIHEYLHYGWVPEPRTLLKGVTKLRPGHLVTVEVDVWRIEEHRYWRFEDAPPVEGDPAAAIRAELDTIAGLIVRSDVPVGVALSGGLDSSLIAALTAKKYPGTLQAFTVGYRGRPRQDERHMARAFADHLGMPLHEVEISVEEMVDFFPELNTWRDDPIADIAGFGYYALNRAAREQGCPVLIQGQGGDELFWGYPWTVRAVQETLLKAAGRTNGFFSRLAGHLPTSISRPQMVQALYLLGGLLHGWKKLGPAAGAPAEQIAFYDLCDTYQIGAHGAHRTYHPTFARRLGNRSAATFFQLPQPWPQADLLTMRLLCESYLLQNGLAQGDRLAMASSVELRLPLVDYRLVELVVGLQKARPSHGLPPKTWLKDAVKDIVPQGVLDRPKRGFNPPVTPWIRALKARHGGDLADGYLVQREILAPGAAKLLMGRNSRFSPWNDLFFKYLVLESWCRGMAAMGTGACR
jgi:asparagine synthase (glutamine-hydrolysing)